MHTQGKQQEVANGQAPLCSCGVQISQPLHRIDPDWRLKPAVATICVEWVDCGLDLSCLKTPVINCTKLCYLAPTVTDADQQRQESFKA